MTPAAISDFCRAVLADNRPRRGEPWDTIANAINAGRRRAYRAGYERGLALAAGSGTAETNEEDKPRGA